MQSLTSRAALLVILASLPVCASRPAPEASSSFAMEDASVLEVMDQVTDLTRGSYTQCEKAPDGTVGNYPELSSDEPWYGVLHLERSHGDDAPESEGVSFVFDESGGTGTGYDKLYVDRDGDRDLADETALGPVKTPPTARNRGSSVQEIFFETFTLACGTEPDTAPSIEVVPRLVSYTGRPPYASFLQGTVKKGKVTIADRKYLAVLGHPHTLSPRFDAPDTGLFLIGEGVDEHGWWGRDTLKAVRKLGDTLYTFSTSPTGDELTVTPYAGEMGIFQVGAGERELEGELTANGSLSSPKRNVAVGGEAQDGWLEAVAECRVPAGAYYPSYVRVHFGPLNIFLSNNYHPRDGGARPSEPVRSIKIRPDVPFVLDFSSKPEVFFSSPGDGQVIEAGTTAQVAAVLVDPELDVMIRGLDDTRRKTKEVVSLGRGSETHTFEKDLSLDPKVLITRADGERVVEGVMPFG